MEDCKIRKGKKKWRIVKETRESGREKSVGPNEINLVKLKQDIIDLQMGYTRLQIETGGRG